MALITDAAFTWSSPVTLGADEVWQARTGRVFVTTTASPAANDGILLTETQAVQLAAGLQVRYRREGSTPALIAREAVQ